jgi:ribosome-binding protein aMBF1 (putative translation factor)
MPTTDIDRTVEPSRQNKALLLTWGANVRRARRRAGLTQAELEHGAGLDRGVVQSIELAHVDAALSLWRDVARALGVDLGELTHDVPTGS